MPDGELDECTSLAPTHPGRLHRESFRHTGAAHSSSLPVEHGMMRIAAAHRQIRSAVL